MMFNQKTVLGLVVAAALAPSACGQGIMIDSDVTAMDLVEELLGRGVEFRNAILTAGGGKPFAILRTIPFQLSLA
jgi:hypothetical protein